MTTTWVGRAMKRGCAALLGLVLTMTVLTVAPARAAVSFVDVPPGTLFRHEINWLAERGSNGWDDGGAAANTGPAQPTARR